MDSVTKSAEKGQQHLVDDRFQQYKDQSTLSVPGSGAGSAAGPATKQHSMETWRKKLRKNSMNLLRHL